MKSVSPKAILHQLECFRQMGSVLYVAAHPDDENTELLAYLARGRKYRTAYLSLTRGDGGQNVLGADLGEKLGLARTQELLAARQLDGAHQYFSRAIDFGFSKNYQETLNVWNKAEVLSDVVRVIRQFRPDVVITRFSPTPGGTHGHHTTATILAQEAFKLAGDPIAFREQKLDPWQPKRIFWNVSIWQKDKIANAEILKIDSGGKDFVTDETFHAIASASRAMHKTQGFDTFKLPGGNGEQRTEQFQLLAGSPATKDIMDGVITDWSRVPGGAEIDRAVADIIARFDVMKPAKSVPGLLDLRKKLEALKDKDSVVKEKQEQLDLILQECLGLKTETTVLNADVVPGEPMKLHSSALISGDSPNAVRWVSVRYPLLKKDVKRDVELRLHEASSFDATETMPEHAPLTQPYWLRKEGTPGMFHVDDPDLIGTAENSPSFPIENVFEIDGQKLVVRDEPVQVSTDSAGNQIRRRLDVIPPVSLRFFSEVAIMTPGSARSVEVEVKAARADSKGTLHLEAPSEWKVEPKQQSFDLASAGQISQFTFKLTAPKKSSTAKVTAIADINGLHYRNQRIEINYPHLPRQVLQPPAVVRAVSLDLATRGHTVGYLPGAGDSLVDNLQQMGYAVKVLDDATLASSSKELEGLDAVILGVRAFNVRANIDKAMPALLSYVENGGTMIVQYNRPDKLKSEKIAPYDLKISPERVTNEKAAITFLQPSSPLLNEPNKLTSADFDNWVQERGLYFPNSWDRHFLPILACNDNGEPPAEGSLLVAQYGKGYYIYTGLSFFRQLPAGVPGAYRLFANMVSIGKKESPVSTTSTDKYEH
jgi:LmbE family N-acetylglucosaminyl deacetylase